MTFPLMRPRDTDVLRAEIRRVAGRGGIPVMFGGEVQGDTLHLSAYHGVRAGALRGLAVRSYSGLGGVSMVTGRPMSVADYHNAASITHDYDGPVLSEGLRSVLAVPVVVDGRARAMLYGAYRTCAPFGGQVAELVVASAARISEELRIRDEVDRRLRLCEAQLANAGEGGVRAEQIREVHAELRLLAANSPTAVADRLRMLADKLSVGGAFEYPAILTPLAPRELDVLTQVALGCTNVEAAQRLSLKPETVKSYLRSVAAKLGSNSRHESVSKARRFGLIP